VLACKLRAVVKAVVIAAADDKPAAGDENHDGSVGGEGPGGVDVELEAVLAADEGAVDDVKLGAAVVEEGGGGCAVEGGGPGLLGDGSSEPQSVDGSFGVGHIEE